MIDYDGYNNNTEDDLLKLIKRKGILFKQWDKLNEIQCRLDDRISINQDNIEQLERLIENAHDDRIDYEKGL